MARRLTVTSCCGESFCHACISEPKEQNKPCPECGEEEFTLFKQVKHQRQINKLQVYCTHKERWCGWSGPLELLEAHLDPEQDHCQYVRWSSMLPRSVCEEGLHLPALQRQGHLRGGGGHTLGRVQLRPLTVPQQVWGDVRA